MNAPRHLIVVWVPSHAVAALLLDWRRHLAVGGYVALPTLSDVQVRGRTIDIPQDAEVVTVHADPFRRAVALVLSHPSFPEVPDGEPAPDATLAWYTLHALPASQAAPDAPVLVHVPQRA